MKKYNQTLFHIDLTKLQSRAKEDFGITTSLISDETGIPLTTVNRYTMKVHSRKKALPGVIKDLVIFYAEKGVPGATIESVVTEFKDPEKQNTASTLVA